MNEATKTKIAVLGGGPSALSALYWLTSDQELRDKYEITVYQMGWRLGGKGASGRDANGRIEEHGLHVLFGFYQNFFYMIRTVYGELERKECHPLRTWRQAFHPRDFGVEEEFVQGKWDPWLIAFPANGAVPGSQGALLSLRHYLSMLLQGVVTLVLGWRVGYRFTQALYPRCEKWEQAKDPPLGGDEPAGALRLFRLARGLLILASRVTRWIRRHARWLVSIYKFVRRITWPLVKKLASINRRAHRLWYDLDALLALLTGTLVDELLLEGGFDKIDHLDFREWLLKHGIHCETLTTTLVRTIYDAAFSYENGDPGKQRVSAGSTVRVLTRWAGTYKGAAYYRMHAGMGDVVFTPLYEVLKRRGVRFKFFHKVESLHLSEDKTRIERIHVNQQVDLAPGVEEYNPLVTIKRLECWPSKPRYEQIANADAVKDVDLESYYSGWEGRSLTLEAGRDFDRIIFAIPVAATRFVCKELVDNDEKPEWKRMVEHVKSVQTLSAQLWLKEDLRRLGWDGPEPLLSLFVEPYNTWADMSQVLCFEDWRPGLKPRDVGYFTGAQQGPTDPPDPKDREFPIRMKEAAKRDFVGFLKGVDRNPPGEPGVGGLTTLLPNAVDPDDPRVVDWSLLVDPKNRHGEGRLDAQYWRSNCGPSERCTLSLPNTNQYRMKAGETGYDNLFVTGDWTDNNLYLAFMEAAFQSGILTARAVADKPFPIIGEWLNHL